MSDWQIKDDRGVIHSGEEHEMDSAWDVLTAGSIEAYIHDMREMDTELEKEDLISIYNKWYFKWMGEIVLIQIHKRYR